MTHPLEIIVTERNLVLAQRTADAIALEFYGNPHPEAQLVYATAVMVDTGQIRDPTNQILAYFECRFQA